VIKFIENYFQHKDDRGSITGLLNFGQWEEVNIIESEAGATRGNHYHMNTKELFIILDGKIKITLQYVKDNNVYGEKEEYTVKSGDVFLIDENINHIFEILERSRWMNLLSIKTNSSNPDIIRI
jgi:dTDP-4-dehydrorhamnose 3,5-epimerase-like enzyme